MFCTLVGNGDNDSHLKTPLLFGVTFSFIWWHTGTIPSFDMHSVRLLNAISSDNEVKQASKQVHTAGKEAKQTTFQIA